MRDLRKRSTILVTLLDIFNKLSALKLRLIEGAFIQIVYRREKTKPTEFTQHYSHMLKETKKTWSERRSSVFHGWQHLRLVVINLSPGLYNFRSVPYSGPLFSAKKSIFVLGPLKKVIYWSLDYFFGKVSFVFFFYYHYGFSLRYGYPVNQRNHKK